MNLIIHQTGQKVSPLAIQSTISHLTSMNRVYGPNDSITDFDIDLPDFPLVDQLNIPDRYIGHGVTFGLKINDDFAPP
jgi:hypothetical protein